MWPAKGHVLLEDNTTLVYGSPSNPPKATTTQCAMVLCRPTSSTTVWPGEFMEVDQPCDTSPDSEYGLES